MAAKRYAAQKWRSSLTESHFGNTHSNNFTKSVCELLIYVLVMISYQDNILFSLNIGVKVNVVKSCFSLKLLGCRVNGC